MTEEGARDRTEQTAEGGNTCRSPGPYAPWLRGGDKKWWFTDRQSLDHGPFDTEETCRLRAVFVHQVHQEMADGGAVKA